MNETLVIVPALLKLIDLILYGVFGLIQIMLPLLSN
jgi:hypothetical protein